MFSSVELWVTFFLSKKKNMLIFIIKFILKFIIVNTDNDFLVHIN